jgi:hypothetical protein
MSAKKRAILAIVIFLAAGAAGIALAIVLHRPLSWPALLIYAMIVWNDYHSVAYFSTVIATEQRSQRVIDVTLAILNSALALFFTSPTFFTAVGILFFAVATLKYASQLSVIDNPELLYRKTVIDIIGTIAGSLTMLAILLNQEAVAMPILAGLFSLATIYLIHIRPLYRPPVAAESIEATR